MTPRAASPGATAPGLVVLLDHFFLSERKNACNSPKRVWLLGVDGASKKLAILRPDCGSWDCPFCAKKKAMRWARRCVLMVDSADDDDAFDFVTLTLHEKLPDFTATNAIFSDAWAGLYNALKRYQREITYIGVPELHKNGRVHLHLITNFAPPSAYYIHRILKQDRQVKRARLRGTMSKFWKDIPRTHGWGYANDQEHLNGDTIKAAAYIGKYLGKQRAVNAWPKKFKHIRASHDVPDIDDESELDDQFMWLMEPTRDRLIEKISAYAAFGFRLTNQYTGELLT